MSPEVVITIGQRTLLTALLIAGPLLGAILAVGLVIGVVQSVTSVQESTLTMVPKILCAVGVLGLCMPWMLQKLLDFTTWVFSELPYLIG